MAMLSPSTPHLPHSTSARRHAWWWLVSTPVFFLLAFAAGEGLAAWLGLPEGEVATFSWRELLVLVVALAIFAIPAAGALVAARHSGGDRWAQLPGWILLALVAYFLVMNLVGFFVPPSPG